LESIASGPTVVGPAPSGPGSAALAVVDQFALRDELPLAVLAALLHGTGPLMSEPPVVENRLIGSNRQALEAAVAAAAGLGFEAIDAGDDWQGEAREAGRRFARLVTKMPEVLPAARTSPLHNARCLVAGGETTVTVSGPGVGGRNQEAALAAATVIAGLPKIVIGTFATDGVDGPNDAAGAIVTGEMIPRARENGLDPERYLKDNDSYSFFAATGGLLITGPTGTNVNDLWFGMVY
jgi:hydroxypyruvate reductase